MCLQAFHQHTTWSALTYTAMVHGSALSTPSVALQIIASDGVWDHMKPDEAVECVMEARAGGADAVGAAQTLVKKAEQIGLSSPDREADNTSAIIVFFH